MCGSSSPTSPKIDSSRRRTASPRLLTGTIAKSDERTFSCFSIGSVADTYDEIYVPRIFIPWARLLLERVALGPADAVLDIATGPGTVARLAAEQGGPKGRGGGGDFREALMGM